MNELWLLIALGLGLCAWAAIGHLFWLIGSATIRVLFASRCQNCQRKHFASQGCAADQDRTNSPSRRQQPSLSTDLASMRRLLTHAENEGWISGQQGAQTEPLLLEIAKHVGKTRRVAPAPVLTPRGAVNATSTSTPTQHSQQSAEQPSPASSEVIEATIVSPGDSRLEQSSQQDLDSTAPSLTTPGQQTGQSVPSLSEHARDLEPRVPGAHALERNYRPPAETPRPRVQQRVTASLMKSFMEQSNIRWIELVSAALIVICSVGLVISLWSTLSSTSRFFPSLVFLVATLAVHGAGQYTLKKWKLRTTSRGILHIGLMLIPLSVLVGILLSRRGGEPPLMDFMTVGIIGIGTLVYGGLAYAASRSLFGRRWAPVTLTTTVASASLVAVFGVSQHSSPGSLTAFTLATPLVGLAMWASMQVSLRITGPVSVKEFAARRVAGIVTQSLFATTLVLVFWRLQLRGVEILEPTWWIFGAGIASAWASWGWVAGFASSSRSAATAETSTTQLRMRPGKTPDWLVIFGFCIASGTSLFLLAAGWQLATSRSDLILVLMVIGCWWLFHGARTGTQVGQLAGAMAILGAVALLVETAWNSSQSLQSLDWISFARVVSLLLTGLTSVAVAGALLARAQRSKQRIRKSVERTNGTDSFAWAFVRAGALFALAAVGLTLVASLVPVGQQAFGGDWAPLLLFIYGLVGVCGAAWIRPKWLATKFSAMVMPVSQLIMLLGAMRLCHSSALLAPWLQSLRPGYAWAAGLSLIAPAWAGFGAAMKRYNSDAQPETQQHNIWSLGVGAAVIAAPAALAIWLRADDARLASQLGWFLPTTFLGLYYCWRHSALREAAALSAVVWMATVTWHLGCVAGTWTEAGPVLTIAIMVAVCLLVQLAYTILLLWVQRRSDPELASSTRLAEPVASSSVVIYAALLVLLILIVIPSALAIGSSLGVRFASPAAWLQSLTVLEALALLLVTIVALVMSVWASRTKLQEYLAVNCSLLPLMSAMLVAAVVPQPWPLRSALWILAGWLLASELLNLCGRSWQQISAGSWQVPLEKQAAEALSTSWLVCGRALTAGLLLLLTSIYLARGWTSGLPPGALSLSSMSWVAGPVIVVASVRWLLALVLRESSTSITAAGCLASGALACFSTLAFDGAPQLPRSSIYFLQVLSLTTATLALLSILYVGATNLQRLRRAPRTGARSKRLIGGLATGRHFRQMESSAWSMNSVAIACVAVLSASCAVAAIWFPAGSLPGLSQLGSLPTGLSLVVCGCVGLFLASRKGISGFSSLALLLGLGAPIVAASYASHLIQNPTWSFATARGFEPLRLLIAAWLTALVGGLVYRLLKHRLGAEVAKAGEWCWLLLAGLVAALALVSARYDPVPLWPAVELSVLALVGVVSGFLANQPWRGHLAAVSASAAISIMVFQSGVGQIPEQLWMILWGPAWVASVSLCLQLWTGGGTQRHHGGWLRGVTVDQTVSVHLPLGTILCSFACLPGQGSGTPLPGQWTWWLLSLTLVSLGLAISRLWYHQSGWRGSGLYWNVIASCSTLAIILCATGELSRLHSLLAWLTGVLLGMAVMACLLRELIRQQQRKGTAPRIGAVVYSEPRLRAALTSMSVLHGLFACLCLIPSVALVMLIEERPMRLAATALPLLGAMTLLPIATNRQSHTYRYIGLFLATVTVALISWADLPHAWASQDLAGAWIFVQRTMVALAVVGVVYPAVARLLSDKQLWEQPLMHLGWLCVWLAGGLGAVLLVGQVDGPWSSVAREVGVGTKLLTLSAWTLIFARFLQFAARPFGLDHNAPDSLRQAAVYLAELSLAGFSFAAHGHFPNLFGGIIATWWPVVLFAIAIASAAVGQWLRGSGQKILADPVSRSSLLLPLVPLTAVWWIQPSGAQWHWNQWDRYALVLLSSAGVYGLHGWLRNSLTMRAVSASLALASFWSLLHSSPNLSFFAHPQLWLLPPSLAVLAFTELNRGKLSASTVVVVRYVAILLAYMSSASEVFLNAFDGQMWQPVVLLALSLAGVGAGIALRVRAFLYCGVTFTFLALVGMVWHAQQAIDQVWPWWAFGIATGVCLIIMLGYFEKNRPKVAAYLNRFKQWES